MTRKRTVRIAVFLLPVLLGWIALLGELNRRLDRFPRIEMPVTAQTILGTSYSGPRLVFSGPVFEPRPLTEKQARAGSEVLLRYRRDKDDWVFEGLGSERDRKWSRSEVDIPGRVERALPEGALTARPLVPADFAVSRATISRIRFNARVTLIVARGAFGNVWIESAVETGEALGTVAGLAGGAGGEVLAYGVSEQRLDPRVLLTGPPEGWIARIEEGKIGGLKSLPAQPLAAARLGNGALQVAIRGPLFIDRGFEILSLGPDLTATLPPRRFDRFFCSLAGDGSVWSQNAPDMAPPREGNRLIHGDSAGNLLADIPMPASGVVTAVDRDFVAVRNADTVVRYGIEKSRLVETDRWTVENLLGAAFSTPDTLIAGGQAGVFTLNADDPNPRLIFTPNPPQKVIGVHAGATGDLVIFTVDAAVRPRPAMGRTSARIWFLPKTGTAIDLGEAGASEENIDPQGSNRVTKDRRVIVRGNELFLAFGRQILVFDLSSRQLTHRIAQRASGKTRPIF
jgi:hypothetical protein